MTAPAPDFDSLKSRYDAQGQAHVFQYYSKLSSNEEKQALLDQLADIDVESLKSALEVAGLLDTTASEQDSNQAQDNIAPIDSDRVGRLDNLQLVKSWRQTGKDAVSKNKVAALVLAGGQGTRLGYSGPKGMYDIGLPSGKTLFQLIAERLQRLGKLCGGNDDDDTASVPFYIMTSPLNHKETVEYFESNAYFGLKADSVYFFEQGMLPCVNEQGKIIMEAKNKVAMAPDGNGGIYPSLQKSGALTDMRQRGVEYLHVFSIDNALVRPADPVFMGYCIDQKADCGNKVVWKSHAHEKVGVLATRNNKPCVVEYSEITKEMAEQCEDGRLVYGAANICNHFYTLDFIEHQVLPNMGSMYHIARKKIPEYNAEQDDTVTPDTNNGIKLETFIFDVFPLSQNMAILDVPRDDEFSPVKNKDGADSPETARIMTFELAKKWLKNAGAKVVDNDGDKDSCCEISPLTSYAGEGLEEYKDKEISCPFSL